MLVCRIGVRSRDAYGWVEMDTPAGIPLQIVVGRARDPIMCACIRVANLAQTMAFCQESLGMTEQAFPLARKPGSDFEPRHPANSVYVTHTPETMGQIFTQAQANEPKVDVGTLFQGFGVVADDVSPNAKLPVAVQQALSGDRILTAPDGYRFRIQPLSEFQRAI